MKIYTKTGDQGMTSLFTGKRVPKDDITIEALGTIDECNSALGISLSLLPSSDLFIPIRSQLQEIQNNLFNMGAAIATPRSQARESKINHTPFDEQSVKDLEKWIDQMEAALPTLHTFILPGGNLSAAHLHLARTICRRAERRVYPLYSRGDTPQEIIIYLNRLSDYLFSLARFVNFLNKTPDILWKP